MKRSFTRDKEAHGVSRSAGSVVEQGRVNRDEQGSRMKERNLDDCEVDGLHWT